MITEKYLIEEIKNYNRCTCRLITNANASGIAYRLNKNHYNEYQVSKAIDMLIDTGERFGYSEIVKNIPRDRQQEKPEEITPEIKALAKKEWLETKDHCVNDFQCSTCRIQYCTLQANILLGKGGSEKGLISSMADGEISRAQASDILGKFKGINWGLDFPKKETKGIRYFTKKANSFKWEKE